jgi:hypothetical protein
MELFWTRLFAIMGKGKINSKFGTKSYFKLRLVRQRCVFLSMQYNCNHVSLWLHSAPIWRYARWLHVVLIAMVAGSASNSLSVISCRYFHENCLFNIIYWTLCFISFNISYYYWMITRSSVPRNELFRFTLKYLHASRRWEYLLNWLVTVSDTIVNLCGNTVQFSISSEM